MSTDLPPLANMELLVHGRLPAPVVLPPNSGHPLELWIKPTPEVELFSTLVGRQCGATIQGGRLWLFRPVPMTLQGQDGQPVEIKKMIALDGGPFPPHELDAIRKGGVTVRYMGASRTVFVVTQGDVVTLPPILATWVKVEVRSDPVEPLSGAAVEPGDKSPVEPAAELENALPNREVGH